MKIVDPKAELWIQEDPVAHIARCARVCYASEFKSTDNDEKLNDALIKRGHLSMLRHWSMYYIFPADKNDVVAKYLRLFDENPYIEYYIDADHTIYLATNGQYMYDNPGLSVEFNDYKVLPEEFESRCHSLMRYTFCLDTSIAVSRELNRKSPNSIAEQSTRYIQFGGTVEPSICKPHWMEDVNMDDFYTDKGDIDDITWQYLRSCEDSFCSYENLIKLGLPKEDARGVLPLETLTKVVYTYSVREWAHIINLRYFGTTGKPHPDAKIITGQVKDILTERLKGDWFLKSISLC